MVSPMIHNYVIPNPYPRAIIRGESEGVDTSHEDMNRAGPLRNKLIGSTCSFPWKFLLDIEID